MPQMKRMTKHECRMTKECPIAPTEYSVIRASLLIRHSDFVIRSIHIPLVALLAFQLLDVFVRLFDALAALLLDNLAQGCIHVLGHAARVTANEKLRALGVDPFPDVGRVFSHLVLDIDFLGLITRPRAIQPRENSL